MGTIIAVSIVVAAVLWMAYEIWRAPLMEETEDGGLRIIRPTKKFTDLFKYKKKRK